MERKTFVERYEIYRRRHLASWNTGAQAQSHHEELILQDLEEVSLDLLDHLEGHQGPWASPYLVTMMIMTINKNLMITMMMMMMMNNHGNIDDEDRDNHLHW